MGSTASTAFDYNAQLMNDTKAQSIERPSAVEVKGEGKPRIDGVVPNAKDDVLWKLSDEKVTTLYELIAKNAETFADKPQLGHREVLAENKWGDFKFLTYAEAFGIGKNLGAGLTTLGLEAKSNVGIFAPNRVEWVVAQIGCYSQSMAVVSLYATLGNDAVEYITNHAELQTIFTSKANLPTLLAVLDKVSHTSTDGKLKNIVVFPENGVKASEEDIKTCGAGGVTLHDYDAIIAAGEEAKAEVVAPSPDDFAFIMYTSGTTGNPKGVLLSHRNVMATLSVSETRIKLAENARHLSYLPLAHIFETIVQFSLYKKGGACGFFTGSIKNLTSDLQALEPTVFAGVPRVFDKIYKKVMAGVEDAPCLKSWYFHRAYAGISEAVRNGGVRDDTYDTKVFIPLRAKLGLGKCTIILTGAAPCPPYLMEFLKVAIGAAVCQGYGLTETAAAAAIMYPDDTTTGQNGPPVPCNEIKLVDVPEMEYLNTDKPYSRGEIWIRGDNIFVGYYKNPEATAECLTDDGWFKTGDIGRWNPNGTLSIIDRKKNIFKLSQGEYIAAEKIEAVYSKSSIVGQIFVYGNSFKSFVLAVVVPDALQVLAFMKEHKFWTAEGEAENKVASPEFLAEYAKVFKANEAAINKHVHAQLKLQEKALKGFEKVRGIVVEGRLDAMLAGFTEANACTTPTFKLRRPFLLRRYVVELKALYAKLGEAPTADEHWAGEETAKKEEEKSA